MLLDEGASARGLDDAETLRWLGTKLLLILLPTPRYLWPGGAWVKRVRAPPVGDIAGAPWYSDAPQAIRPRAFTSALGHAASLGSPVFDRVQGPVGNDGKTYRHGDPSDQRAEGRGDREPCSTHREHS